MYATSISTINIIFNSMFSIFFSKYVTTIQSNCTISFQEFFEIPNIQRSQNLFVKWKKIASTA